MEEGGVSIRQFRKEQWAQNRVEYEKAELKEPL